MKSKIQKSLIQTNIKNILLAIAIKTYLGKDEVYNFINNMIEENKYCLNVMKKHFNKELLMTKEDNDDFKNYTTVGSVTIIMMFMIMIMIVIMMLKQEIIVISLENIEALHIETVMSILN